MKKVALLTNIPAPYREPMFTRMHALCSCELKIFYCAAIEDDRKWQIDLGSYEHEVLSGVHYKKNHLNISVLSKVLFADFDLIIVDGYGFATVQLIALVNRLVTRKSMVLLSDGAVNYWHSTESRLKNWIKRFFIGSYSKAFVSGTNAKNHLRHYGFNGDAIKIVKFACDDTRFFESRVDGDRLGALKKQCGLSRYVLIYVGKIEEAKGIDRLVESLLGLEAFKQQWSVLFVGEGPMRRQVEKTLTEAGVNHHCTGYVQQEDLAAYYRLADLFILPSQADAWGLVVNEAMHCGLPVIATRSVGAVYDLVVDGENGFVIPTATPEHISTAVETFIKAPELLKQFGERSSEIIKDWTIEESATLFCEQIQVILEHEQGTH